MPLPLPLGAGIKNTCQYSWQTLLFLSLVVIFHLPFLFPFILGFWDRVALRSPKHPETHSVDQAGHEPSNLLPAFAPSVLGLKARDATARPCLIKLKQEYKEVTLSNLSAMGAVFSLCIQENDEKNQYAFILRLCCSPEIQDNVILLFLWSNYFLLLWLFETKSLHIALVLLGTQDSAYDSQGCLIVIKIQYWEFWGIWYQFFRDKYKIPNHGARKQAVYHRIAQSLVLFACLFVWCLLA